MKSRAGVGDGSVKAPFGWVLGQGIAPLDQTGRRILLLHRKASPAGRPRSVGCVEVGIEIEIGAAKRSCKLRHRLGVPTASGRRGQHQ